MKSIGSGNFVLGVAALITVVTAGGHAPALAGPPVEYVRVCQSYGNGFLMIPGTDTCIRLSAGGQVGYGGGSTRFDVTPSFDVNGSGFAWGVNGMALVGIPNTGLSVGPRISYFGGNMGGSTYYPFSGGTYTVTNKGMAAAEFVAQYSSYATRGTALRAYFGAIDTRTQTEYGVVRTFPTYGYDTASNVGFTTGVGISAPLPQLYDGLSITGDLRYIGVTNNINIPGAVGTHRDMFIATVGLEWTFIQQPGWKQ
jgi:hypothetical protein